LHWDAVVNVSQIVRIVPKFSEPSKDPETDPVGVTFQAYYPKDDAEVAEKNLYAFFEVTDSLGQVYWSPFGDNGVHRFLKDLYAASEME